MDCFAALAMTGLEGSSSTRPGIAHKKARHKPGFSGAKAKISALAFEHQLLDLADGLRRVQPLGAGLGAVHDGVAAIELERDPPARPGARRWPRRGCRRSSDRPAAARPGPGNGRRSTNSSGRRWSSRSTGCIPTDRRAWRALPALQALAVGRRRGLGLQPGLDRAILGVGLGQVGHQILHHRHMRQRVDLDRRPCTSSIGFRQASVLVPSMFMAQEPQMPSRQERRKVSVVSISFLILMIASRTIGPQSSRSTS